MALPANITQARETAQSLAAGAGELGAKQFTVGDVLKQKALDAYKSSQDIIKPLDEATTGYLQAPSEARAKYSDPTSENYIFNPFQAEKLTSQYVGQQSLPMLMLSSMLGQRFGRMEDIVGTGTRAFQAQSAAQQAKATQAQNLYTNLLNEYQLTKPSYSTLDLGGTKAIIDEEGNITQRYPVTKKPGTADDSSDIYQKILEQYLNQGRGTAEPEPQYSPAGGAGSFSEGGGWYFDGADWLQVVD